MGWDWQVVRGTVAGLSETGCECERVWMWGEEYIVAIRAGGEGSDARLPSDVKSSERACMNSSGTLCVLHRHEATSRR